MKSIKCMIGWHDWEVCKISKIVGWAGFENNIPVYMEEGIECDYCYEPAKEKVCLRCGKMNGGIEFCFKEADKRLEDIQGRYEIEAKRKALAKDLCKMG